jgi:hypothetical protein
MTILLTETLQRDLLAFATIAAILEQRKSAVVIRRRAYRSARIPAEPQLADAPPASVVRCRQAMYPIL